MQLGPLATLWAGLAIPYALASVPSLLAAFSSCSCSWQARSVESLSFQLLRLPAFLVWSLSSVAPAAMTSRTPPHATYATISTWLSFLRPTLTRAFDSAQRFASGRSQCR